ncbi:MAG: nucleobase:cation symporter-2 family protein [Negativicutes bacterium]|jgi:xanthine permease
MQNSNVFRNFSLGLQHVLAMYAGSVAVPLIIGAALKFNVLQMTILVSADLLASGIATLLQASKLKGIGIRLPVVLGTAFPVVSPLIAIGLQYDFQTAIGATMVAGVFVFLNASYFGKLSILFPPVVIGSVVAIIGLSLAPVAINSSAGGVGSANYGDPVNFLFAAITLLVIVLFSRYAKGFMQTISVLLGIVAGTVVAAIGGYVDMSAMQSAQWIHAVRPLAFGWPKFEIIPIITMCIVALVSQVESAGVFMILSEICGKKVTKESLARGFRAEGLALIFSGLFNSFSKTTYSQNVGLIELTKVKKTLIVVYSGVILAGLSFLPKFAALVLAVPSAVLGGAMIAMFGMVAVAGINTMAKADMTNIYNMLIVACSLTIGVGISVTPAAFEKLPLWAGVFTGSGIVMGAATAIILNVVFNHKKKTAGKQKIESEEILRH